MTTGEWLPGITPWPAVVPVLVGPLQTLLAMLPAIVVGLATLAFALFTPAGFRRVVRFFWRQKLFALVLLTSLTAAVTLISGVRSAGNRPTLQGAPLVLIQTWSTFHGDPQRSGQSGTGDDPAVGEVVWKWTMIPTVYSSPAIVGDLVIFSTATDIGPFNPVGRGAIVALDARSGIERWRYAPDDFRATFSSPVVSDGCVVCGEGLHQVQDARITCLDLQGRRQWEFRTNSHVEATPAIADGRVFVGAGDDGFYCLELRGDGQGQPRVLWHLEGQRFADCESSPVVVDDVVYFGLGENGQAVCAVDAQSGELKWKMPTPHPVFAAPTWVPAGDGERGPKLVVAMGNGNMIQSAQEVRQRKLVEMKAAGASDEQLAEAERALAATGQIWCIDVRTQTVDWRYLTDDTILGSVAYGEGRLYFGCRDGTVHCLTLGGSVVRRLPLYEPLVTSPAVGRSRVFFTTTAGRLVALDAQTLAPNWEVSLGGGPNLTSSPVLAHGHIYVGTPHDGLYCLGTKARQDSAVWTRGELGGAADRESVPDVAEVTGEWPGGDERFDAIGPLAVADDRVYAVGRYRKVDRLVRLDPSVQNSQSTRAFWETACSPIANMPITIVGSQLISVERVGQFGRPDVEIDSPFPNPAAMPVLMARNVQDGQITWRMQLMLRNLRGWTCDTQRAYLLGSESILVFALQGGMPRWGRNFATNNTTRIEPVGDMLLVSQDDKWMALDGDIGAVLWELREAGAAVRLLDAGGNKFISYVGAPGQPPVIQLRRVTDGGLVWQTTWPWPEPPTMGRLSVDHALLATVSGRWRVLQLDDGSAVGSWGDDWSWDGMPDGSRFVAVAPTHPSPIQVRSRVVDFDPRTGLRIFDMNDRRVRAWVDLKDVGTPITPLVETRGRICFASDRGKIVCVAAARKP